MTFRIVRAYPYRSLRKALRYLRPRRLTLKHNPRIHAWLWWNIATEPMTKVGELTQHALNERKG